MHNFLVKTFGASWQTTLAGLFGGIAIAAWPILQSALVTQGSGVKVDWSNVLMGVVVAVVGYLAKSHNVSNSPTPLADAQLVVPVPTEHKDVAPMAQPAVIPKPEPPPGKF